MATHTLFALTLLAASAIAQHAPLNTPAADTSLPKLAGKRFVRAADHEHWSYTHSLSQPYNQIVRCSLLPLSTL